MLSTGTGRLRSRFALLGPLAPYCCDARQTVGSGRGWPLNWEHIGYILDDRSHELYLLQRDPSPPTWAWVDTSRLRVKRLGKSWEGSLS
jgi:hypothetical protein